MSPDRVVPWAVALLVALGILFLISPLLYWASYTSSLADRKDVEAAYDCAAFAYPCLAGIFAGFGLVSERGKDYRHDRNAICYLVSALLLAAAYFFYVARHPRPLVLLLSGLYVCLVGFAALETLLIQHFLTPGQDHDQNEHSEIVSSVVDVAPASNPEGNLKHPAGPEPDTPIISTEKKKLIPAQPVIQNGLVRARWGTTAGIAEGLMAAVLCLLVAEVLALMAYTLTTADVSVMRLRADK
jgi:hypothetical protein